MSGDWKLELQGSHPLFGSGCGLCWREQPAVVHLWLSELILILLPAPLADGALFQAVLDPCSFLPPTRLWNIPAACVSFASR